MDDAAAPLFANATALIFGGAKGIGKAVALEWSRLWGYHEKEDLGGGKQNLSVLKLLGRIAL